MGGFKDFILRGNVVDLAVGVVIGGAFGGVVTAFTKDLVTPMIAALVGKPDFSAIEYTINGTKFPVGDFLNAVVAFLLVAAAIYYVIIVPMNAMNARMAKPVAPAAPATKTCPECVSEVPLAAKRCAHCTSALAA
ncbi:MAG: large conductance mechanosensitive channel protein MscL [Acidobacteriia bacterium]|jgi:large conductance mechanosensitive channel|nr:large conductance mechanosensitive channel protein MscL [Terriglobia bacterium]